MRNPGAPGPATRGRSVLDEGTQRGLRAADPRHAVSEQEMIERSHRRTVPQMFLDGKSIGGYDDLAQLNATGELDRLLGAEPA